MAPSLWPHACCLPSVVFLKISSTFAPRNGSVAQLNRASDYGSEGYRFESCRSHKNISHLPLYQGRWFFYTWPGG
jgi:hypothetical protein